MSDKAEVAGRRLARPIVGPLEAVPARAAIAGPRLKRALDVFGASSGLVLLAPALLAVAAAIKLDSPGPALFVQERVGKHGKPFKLYKFRSMQASCDTRLHEQHVVGLIRGAGDEARSPDGSFKLRDSRVTRVGRLLRRTSIDELPQLINVLKGEMSLVGPRPAMAYEVAEYAPRHLRRLEVLPGMTGLWQVSGRAKLGFEEMVALDVSYVDRWSFSLDLRILLKTISAVVSEEGAG